MKLPYFKLGEAINDVKHEFSYGNVGDKAGSIAKLTGKTVANIGLLAVDLGVDIITNLPEYTGKMASTTLENENSRNLTEEQRERLTELVKIGEAHRKGRDNS